MAGRDQAIAAALDELIQAAADLPPERSVEQPSGTLVARNRRAKLTLRTGRWGRAVDLDGWWSGRPDLNRRPPAPKLAHSERLAKPRFCRLPSSGTSHIRVS
jgi:hypothetical protein